MRSELKRRLARLGGGGPSTGATVLIYHRVGGGSADERDVATASFVAQLEILRGQDVVSIDAALDRLDAADRRPTVVLTFDDGFGDLYAHAWPLLRDRGLPFTLYLATGYVGGAMHWEGSTASGPAPGLTWAQVAEMANSGLCTVGNHTHTHPAPVKLTPAELDCCSDAVEEHLGAWARPRHFAFTWGVEVPWMRQALRVRFRSAATGRLGRNLPGYDPMALRRVPVRGSDPIEFFAAKINGRLLPERAYSLAVATAKRLGVRA